MKPTKTLDSPKSSGIRTLFFDRVGVFASSVCAIHCIVSGFAMSLLSVLGASGFASARVEIGFLSAALVFGMWAAISGFSKHRKIMPPLLFGAGITMILYRSVVIERLSFASFYDAHQHIHAPNSFSVGLSVIGGGLLIIFHIQNIKLSHNSTCKLHCH